MARRRRRTSSSDSDPERTGGLFRTLDTAGKRLIAAVLTAGALATAVGAIVALLPDPDPDPDADLAEMTVGLMTLDEYVERHGGDRASHTQSRFATYLAQDDTATPAIPEGDSVEPEVGDESDETPGVRGTPGPGQTQTGEDTPPTITDAPPPSTSTTTTEEGDGDDEAEDVGPRLGSVLRERLALGVPQALEDPALVDVGLPERCVEDLTDPACGRAIPFMLFKPADPDGPEGENSAEEVEQRLVRIFRHTRTAPPDPTTGERPLLGVDVNLDVVLTGLADKTADVHWSLHQVGGDLGAVPEAWFDKRVLSMKVERDPTDGSPEFWVPVPRGKGPFFLRVSIHHDGERLDRLDSSEFG